FDFYTLLPESEVTLPMAEPSSRPAPEKQADRSGANDKKGDTKGSVSSSGVPRKYLLQAGSFRNAQDADRLRAQLLLQGLNPKVEKVNVGSGETWHRVQLGPFIDRSSLHNAQQVLASQNIDSLLLQLK
ncbi:MAG: SPOR domain-containing protein, partial [Endozoicomonas sp.]